MRTIYETGLTLLEYCEVTGINPWTMAQFGAGFPLDRAVCDKVIYQHHWQQNYLSREEIAQSIQLAERKIAEQLQFWPYPRYIQNDEINYPQTDPSRMRGGGADARGYWKSVRASWGKIIAVGILARTVLSAGVAPTFSDEDGDGIEDTFEVAVVVPSSTLPDEIGVYFKPSDRVGTDKSDGERWRIRPVSVTVSGVNATIRGHKSLLAKPLLYEGFSAASLDVTVNSNFVAEVAVYRVYTDTQATADYPNQGNAIWENVGCVDEDCTKSYAPVCVSGRDAERGALSVNYTVTTPPYQYEPKQVALNYLAGVPFYDGRMKQEYASLVAKLATALLMDDKCGCDRAQRIIAYWREPIFGSGDNAAGYAPDDTGKNPFGIQRGAIEAWRGVMELGQVWGLRL